MREVVAVQHLLPADVRRIRDKRQKENNDVVMIVLWAQMTVVVIMITAAFNIETQWSDQDAKSFVRGK